LNETVARKDNQTRGKTKKKLKQTKVARKWKRIKWGLGKKKWGKKKVPQFLLFLGTFFLFPAIIRWSNKSH